MRRTPHGVRGLKYMTEKELREQFPSHPAWGAWIEMVTGAMLRTAMSVAPRMGCVD